MARAVALLLLVGLSLSLLGCGSVWIAATFNPSVSTISGLVVEVHATNIPGGDGTLILVTIVTFQQGPSFTS